MRDVVWRGIDPDRVEAAHVAVTGDRLTARGTSVGAEHALQWSLTTGPEFVTRELSVLLRGDTVERTLRLTREAGGGWSALRSEHPVHAPADARTLPLPDLADALDCDLGLCPMTNLMPVLRHDLVAAARDREDRSVRFVMALVQVPELVVEPSVQTYTAVAPLPDGGATVHFASDGFEAGLELDADGLVRNYPELAFRIG